MAPVIDKAAVIDFLRECPGGELADVMSQVLPGRPEAEPEPMATEFRLYLGLAFRENVAADSEDEVRWGPWRLSAVGYLDPALYRSDFPGEPFLQNGQCSFCAADVWSHVKGALCPICGARVSLT